MTAKPTLLTWYPHSPTEWRRLVRGLSVEEEGALSRARDEAWDSEEHPAALVDTPDTWARVLGVHWKRLLPVVKRFFSDDSGAGVVRWPWLWGKYVEQQTKYARRATAGHEGGQKAAEQRRTRTRRAADKGSNASSNATSNAGSNASSNGGSNRVTSASRAEGERDGGYPRLLTEPGGTTPRASVDASLSPGGDAPPSAGEHDAVHGPRDVPSLTALFAAEAGADAVAPPAPLPDAPPATIDDPAVIAQREQRRAALRRMLHSDVLDAPGGVATLDARDTGGAP